MDARFQRRIQRYGWDKAVSVYEAYWAKQIEPSQRLLLQLARLQPGERVLDVACGTGLVTFPAAEIVGPGGHVLGTDISEGMIEDARQAASRLGLHQTSFARMGAEDLRLEDETFDVALCALGLMYVPDPVRALAEMRRVLRSGGRAVAAVWGARDRCGWAQIFPIVDARVDSDVCPMFFQLGTGDALTMAFELAGFVDVQAERISVDMRYETAEAALGAAFAGGPVALAYSRFDERTRQQAHDEYLASIEPYRNGRGYVIPGEFVVARGREAEDPQNSRRTRRTSRRQTGRRPS